LNVAGREEEVRSGNLLSANQPFPQLLRPIRRLNVSLRRVTKADD
jgi:hypothetical protein